MISAMQTIGALGSAAAAERQWDRDQAAWDAAQAADAEQAASRKRTFLAAPDAAIFECAIGYSKAPELTAIAQFIIRQALAGNVTAQKFVAQVAEVYAEHGDEFNAPTYAPGTVGTWKLPKDMAA